LKQLTPYQKAFLTLAAISAIALALLIWGPNNTSIPSKPIERTTRPNETLEERIERLDKEARRLREDEQQTAEQKRIEDQMKRLSRVCDKVKDKKVVDLTTHEHELINACNAWDVTKIEELSSPTWWEKLLH
jgi:hypothetical protein